MNLGTFVSSDICLGTGSEYAVWLFPDFQWSKIGSIEPCSSDATSMIKSAGLWCCGHSNPKFLRKETIPVCLPLYTVSPNAKTVTLSKSSKILADGWCMVHTITSRKERKTL